MPTLDPIFPLPADTGINRNLKEGEGTKILNNDTVLDCGLTYRAFWHIWEQIESKAAHYYPRYINGHSPYIAHTWLEAVVWCRSIGHPLKEILPISESKAAKIRAKEAKIKPVKGNAKSGKHEDPLACSECQSNDLMKSRRAGIAGFKCRQCKHWWPAEAPRSVSKGPEVSTPSTPSKADTKKKSKPEKSKKKGKKAKKKGRG